MPGNANNGQRRGPYVTIAEQEQRHAREQRRLVLGALDRCGWRLRPAAEQLDVTPSTLQRLIERHGLSEMYANHAHRPGRPARDP